MRAEWKMQPLLGVLEEGPGRLLRQSLPGPMFVPQKHVDPDADIQASAQYRRMLVGVLTARVLAEAAENAANAANAATANATANANAATTNATRPRADS